jgi:acetyl esterase/lipase
MKIVEHVWFDAAKRGTVEKDVTYAVMGGRELKMDIYYPKSHGLWSGLIFVHGGGWSEGDKAPLAIVPPGYLVASINYRLYPEARFPAMIEDVKCAIRYLRAHAAAYNLDPNRIGLIGHSAGAHLAALAGLVGTEAGWDIGPYLEHSSAVQAVVALSGPSDLTRNFADEINQLKNNVFGQDDLVKSSPVNMARLDAPPFLIVHGDRDAVVPVEQAHLLHTALANAGSRVHKIIVQNAGHGFEPVEGKMWPPFNWVIAMMLLFLAWHLRK